VGENRLDASIDTGTAQPNDFAALLRTYPEIHTIFFNGQKSAQLFQLLAKKNIESQENVLSYVSLPSTSPAHAAMSFKEKLVRWTAVRDAVEQIKPS
jgi:TDG/mug DNA glycosylase family protein